MTKQKVVDAVLAVLIAVALWAFVINVVNPPDTKTMRDIPVNITGADELTRAKLAIAGEADYTVDVVVGGSRAELVGITEENITATADISSLTAGQNYINVAVTIPDNLTLEDIRSQKIQVYVEDLVIQDKPLHVAYGEAAEGYEATVLRSDSDMVPVSGARSLVERVTEVRVDLDVTNLLIDSPHTQKLEGLPLDEEGNIVTAVKLPSEGIGVTAAIYPQKTVPLQVPVSGSPAYQASVRNVDAPDTITIKGHSSRLESVSSIEAEEISIDGIKANGSYEIVPKLPIDVYLSDGSEELLAQISLVDAGQITYTYGASDLVVEGLADGYEYEISGGADLRITATAHGTLDALDKLGKRAAAPLINLSFLESGTHDVAIETSYGSGDITFDFSPSILTVTLIQPAEESEPEGGEGGEESGEDGETVGPGEEPEGEPAPEEGPPEEEPLEEGVPAEGSEN